MRQGAWGLVAGAHRHHLRRRQRRLVGLAARRRRGARPWWTSQGRLPRGARGARDGGTSAHREARPTNEPGTRPRDDTDEAAPLAVALTCHPRAAVRRQNAKRGVRSSCVRQQQRGFPAVSNWAQGGHPTGPLYQGRFSSRPPVSTGTSLVQLP